MEKVFPQWVRENREGYKDLTIGGFEALTVEALRELKADFYRKMSGHKKKLAELTKIIKAQEKEMATLAAAEK